MTLQLSEINCYMISLCNVRTRSQAAFEVCATAILCKINSQQQHMDFNAVLQFIFMGYLKNSSKEKPSRYWYILLFKSQFIIEVIFLDSSISAFCLVIVIFPQKSPVCINLDFSQQYSTNINKIQFVDSHNQCVPILMITQNFNYMLYLQN